MLITANISGAGMMDTNTWPFTKYTPATSSQLRFYDLSSIDEGRGTTQALVYIILAVLMSTGEQRYSKSYIIQSIQKTF